MMNIQKNLSLLRTAIAESEARHGRQSHSVSLIAVSKAQSIEKIQLAIGAGQYAFGENYLQEALPKIIALADEKITWHFIGPIQTNKTKKIAEHFAWAHSVCDIKIAERLHQQRPAHLTPLNICLQINISQEASKAGVDISKAYHLATECMGLTHIRLRGLMAIPNPRISTKELRAQFKALEQLRLDLTSQGIPLDTLSLGMSQDWDEAIAEGSTMVRIGTAIFGSR